MLSKNIDQITFKDLDELKENGVPEDRKLDYKCTLPAFMLIPGQNERPKYHPG